jgi:hypothetical protein
MRRVLVVAAALALSACGTGEPAGSAGPGSTGVAASSTAEQPAESSTVSAPLVRYSVEGGIAGLSRSMEIDEDGSAMVDRGGTPTTVIVDGERLAAIVDSLRASGLFDRDREIEADGADLQKHAITFEGATVVVYDGAIPASLEEAIAMFTSLVSP